MIVILKQILNLGLEYQDTSLQKINDKLLPKGTILCISDKGLGTCLLPLDWYVLQYAVQSEKGNHVNTGMSSEQCINFLKKEIATFRKNLFENEKITLKHYFSPSNPNFRVGVLKLIPKIHKMATFDKESWKKLPSRPIRGAENCPVNAYSKTLCRMLQEMHQSIKVIFGCDEYSEKIQKVTYQNWSKITLISGDVSDAYTKSNLSDFESSLRKLSSLINWPSSKTTLAMKLAKLVFDNCFFETPDGIMKQHQGFPMGGHSSREGLDNILLSCELEILDSTVAENLLYYYRMVDDISTAVEGDFTHVKSLVQQLAKSYPKDMPLNIQISFGYSKYLDSHVFNSMQRTR